MQYSIFSGFGFGYGRLAVIKDDDWSPDQSHIVVLESFGDGQSFEKVNRKAGLMIVKDPGNKRKWNMPYFVV